MKQVERPDLDDVSGGFAPDEECFPPIPRPEIPTPTFPPSPLPVVDPTEVGQ
jgi:hypothetical protein